MIGLGYQEQPHKKCFENAEVEISHLVHLPRGVKKLAFKNCGCFRWAAILERAAAFEYLQSLAIVNCSVSSGDLRFLSSLEYLCYLKLDGNQIFEDSLYELTKLCPLQKLVVVNNPVNQSEQAETLFTIIRSLQALDALCMPLLRLMSMDWSLRLKRSAGNRFEKRYIALAIKNTPNLEVLNMSEHGSRSGRLQCDEAVKLFPSLLERLNSLNLSGLRVTQAAAKALGSLLQLKTLVLRSCGVTDECALLLSAQGIGLERLYLEHNRVTKEGVEPIVANLKFLKLLDLGHNSLRDDGLDCLSAIRPNLLALDIRSCHIGSRGIATAAKSLPQLQFLWLGRTRLDQQSVRAIVTHLQNLCGLRATSSGLTEAQAICVVRGLRKLDTFWVGDNGFTARTLLLLRLVAHGVEIKG